MKSVNQENLKDAEKLQMEIELKLRESRPNMRGAYSTFLKDLLKDTMPNGEADGLVKEAIAEECAANTAQHLEGIDDDKGAVDKEASKDKGAESSSKDKDGRGVKPEESTSGEYWTELRPTPESMGLGKNFSKYVQPAGYVTIHDDDDIDEDEIDKYLILNEDEVTKRNLEWGQLNKEFLEEEEARKKRKLEEEANGTVKKVKVSLSFLLILSHYLIYCLFYHRFSLSEKSVTTTRKPTFQQRPAKLSRPH